MILKTVAYKSRWTNSENFMEAKRFAWKFLVIERKHRISGENISSALLKAHSKCPVEHFEKKMIKVNFTICGFFRSLCVFFCSGRKVSQGSQNHKLNVQSKNLSGIFLSFSTFELRNLEFMQKLLAGLSKPYSVGPEEHFHSNSLEASL